MVLENAQGIKAPIPENTIELSDMFRRHVCFDDADKASALVTLVREFGVACTYIYGEYEADNAANKQALGRISFILGKIDRAAENTVENLTLPLHKNDPMAKMISQNILDDGGFKTRFSFAAKDYNESNTAQGGIDPTIKTVLDDGLIGLTATTDRVRNLWKADIKGLRTV